MLGWRRGTRWRCRRAGPPRVGGGPSGPRRGQVRSFTDSSDAECRPPGWCGQPQRARPPTTAQSPGSTSSPARSGGQRSGAPPEGFSLDGVASGGRVVEMPGGAAHGRRTNEQRCRGRRNAVRTPTGRAGRRRIAWVSLVQFVACRTGCVLGCRWLTRNRHAQNTSGSAAPYQITSTTVS